MVSSNGHRQNGSQPSPTQQNGSQPSPTQQIDTEILQKLIEELVREVTNVNKPLVLSQHEPAAPYLSVCVNSLHSFVDTAKCFLEEAEKTKLAKVNAKDAAKAHFKEMHAALKKIDDIGNHLFSVGEVFIADLMSKAKKQEIRRIAKDLLKAITEYLLLCDRLDVFFTIDQIDIAKTLLHELMAASSDTEVQEKFTSFWSVVEDIDETTRVRLAELKSLVQRDDLLAARSLMKDSGPLLLSASKAAASHPHHISSCPPNCTDRMCGCLLAHGEMERALEGLQFALRGEPNRAGFASSSLLDYGSLAAELEHFQNRVYMEPSAFRGETDRAELEEILERIVTGSAKIADERYTRPERKQRIIHECNNMRQALQDLLNEYEKNRGRQDTSEDVDLAMVLVGRKQRDLKRHLRRAVIDNIGNDFICVMTAFTGIENGFEESEEARLRQLRSFHVDVDRLKYAARLACEMSTDQEGIRIVKYTSEQLSSLVFQVVDAAMLLGANPDSAAAQKNWILHSEAWKDKPDERLILEVKVLTMAVDSLLSVDDFLAVSEEHIVDDATVGIEAIQESKASYLDRSAGSIRIRSLRVCEFMDGALEGVPWGENVRVATQMLREEVVKFSETESLIERLENGPPLSPEETCANLESYTESCKQVLESVKRIRNALLVNRNLEDVDSDNEYEDDGFTQAGVDQKSVVSDVENEQRMMRRLPEEDKKKIQEQIDVFKIATTKFEREVAKWDETGNDIIVLAKHMCMIMTNMTDFTRGRGPLKSTMDVIKAAQEISTAGQKLNVLARQIGDEAEGGNASNEQLKKTNKDLHSYLSKMTLFCQQLNICSKVKADVQQVGDELVVSGLDSATSLIQTARNLLNAVVATVKNAYIISTKFRSCNAPALEWKMSRPRKQPLVPAPPAVATPSARGHGIVRRASEKRPLPMQALSEFHRS